MNIPTEACPIAYPCLLTFRDLSELDPTSIFRSYDEDWEELEEVARGSNPSPTTQRLRAFYALELVYHDVLPQLFFTASDSQMHSAFLSLRAARSLDGLNDVIKLGEKYKRRASAKRTTVALKDEGRDNSAQVVDLLKKHVIIVDQLVKSAHKLRAVLRVHDSSKLVSIGVGLGRALFQASVSESEVADRIHTITTINQKNAVTPWKQPTSEQASSQA